MADWIDSFRRGLAHLSARGHHPDWAAVEARLGHALPQDYRRFVEEIGPGAFEDELFLLAPVTEGRRRSLVGNIGRYLYRDAQTDWSRRCFFMVDGNGNEMAFLMQGADPDRWPVEIFVHEERAPRVWAEDFRSLMLRLGSFAGLFHPGFEADRQMFADSPRSYVASGAA